MRDPRGLTAALVDLATWDMRTCDDLATHDVREHPMADVSGRL
jgi:hypothetical protein